jgi:DNA-binding MarR family transcriptional regulator
MPSSIGTTIKQTKPFASLEQEVSLTLERLTNDLGAELAEVLKVAGVTAAQYNVLRILRGAGEGGLACSEIGERMVTRDSDITRLLDRMEKSSLVSRMRDTDDRRVVKAHITKGGLDILAELDTPVMDLHRRQLGHLSEEKLKKLLALLEEASPKVN